MSSFAKNYQHQCLLEISRRHRDGVDTSRIHEGQVIGQDNWDNLAVSTVFAAVAIEAALNNYVLSHCLFVDAPYLQDVFGKITEQFLRGSIQNKIDLLVSWPDPIPKKLLKEVRELIRIRNRIAHQTGEFRTANETAGSGSEMTNRPLTGEDMSHMLRHYQIARDFLDRFCLPGTRELQQCRVSGELAEAVAAVNRPRD